MTTILENERHCHYCNRDMTNTASALSYAENPFCQSCLGERVANTPGAPENERAVLVGRYFYFSQEKQ